MCTICFTPPYHCELQLIEGIWIVMKHEVAKATPHPILIYIRNKLLKAFTEKVSSKTITDLWRKTLTRAKECRNHDDYVALVENDVEDL